MNAALDKFECEDEGLLKEEVFEAVHETMREMANKDWKRNYQFVRAVLDYVWEVRDLNFSLNADYIYGIWVQKGLATEGKHNEWLWYVAFLMGEYLVPVINRTAKFPVEAEETSGISWQFSPSA